MSSMRVRVRVRSLLLLTTRYSLLSTHEVDRCSGAEYSQCCERTVEFDPVCDQREVEVSA